MQRSLAELTGRAPAAGPRNAHHWPGIAPCVIAELAHLLPPREHPWTAWRDRAIHRSHDASSLEVVRMRDTRRDRHGGKGCGVCALFPLLSSPRPSKRATIAEENAWPGAGNDGHEPMRTEPRPSRGTQAARTGGDQMESAGQSALGRRDAAAPKCAPAGMSCCGMLVVRRCSPEAPAHHACEDVRGGTPETLVNDVMSRCNHPTERHLSARPRSCRIADATHPLQRGHQRPQAGRVSRQHHTFFTHVHALDHSTSLVVPC